MDFFSALPPVGRSWVNTQGPLAHSLKDRRFALDLRDLYDSVVIMGKAAAGDRIDATVPCPHRGGTAVDVIADAVARYSAYTHFASGNKASTIHGEQTLLQFFHRRIGITLPTPHLHIKCVKAPIVVEREAQRW